MATQRKKQPLRDPWTGKREPKADTDSFRVLQKRYNIESPLQLQLYILWVHIQVLTEVHFHPEPLQQYRHLWKVAELEQTRRERKNRS